MPSSSARQRNGRLLRPLKLLLGIVLILLVGVGILVYLGAYDVAADKPHHNVAAWLLDKARERSVAHRARDLDVSLPDLAETGALHDTIVGYEDMCAACHAPPGRDPSAMSQGLNPPAPDLPLLATRRSAEELFWVIKHGIRMTGMPAWGKTHSDEEIEPLVALIKQFPQMDGNEYEALLEEARAAGVEHHHDHHHDANDHDEEPGHDHQH